MSHAVNNGIIVLNPTDQEKPIRLADLNPGFSYTYMRDIATNRRVALYADAGTVKIAAQCGRVFMRGFSY